MGLVLIPAFFSSCICSSKNQCGRLPLAHEAFPCFLVILDHINHPGFWCLQCRVEPNLYSWKLKPPPISQLNFFIQMNVCAFMYVDTSAVVKFYIGFL